VLLVAAVLANSSPTLAQEGHEHHHGGSVPPMDADGRRLDPAAASHEMSDEQLAAMREKVALYRALTDTEARLNMALMGPDYEWYVSDSELQGDTGVLVLAHGVGENSDRLFVKALEPMSRIRPTAVSFGMAMMMSGHIQSAVDDLEKHGVKRIVLVPTGVSKYNSLTRQWEYAFGMRDDSSYLDIPRIKTNAKVLMTNHISDHPLISEALIDYTAEVSKDPANEVVIIVGHGPEDLEDNVPDLAILQVHADRLKAAGKYSDVKVINLQDDAYPPIRKGNVKQLRRWITSAQRSGKKVIVTVCATNSFGVQQHIREDLRGLDYAFAEKGLAEHPNYLKWIETAVDERLALEDSKSAATAKPQ